MFKEFSENLFPMYTYSSVGMNFYLWMIYPLHIDIEKRSNCLKTHATFELNLKPVFLRYIEMF